MSETITLIENESERLSPFEIIVNGKKFLCHEDHRKEFHGYLDTIPEEVVSVTALRLIRIPTQSVKKGRGRTIVQDEASPLKHYHRTVMVTKESLGRFFEDTADRCQRFFEIMAEGLLQVARKGQEDQERKAKEAGWLNGGADI